MLLARYYESYGMLMDYLKTNCFYDTGVQAAWPERLITLATCEYTQKNGRFFVVAKLIPMPKEIPWHSGILNGRGHFESAHGTDGIDISGSSTWLSATFTAFLWIIQEKHLKIENRTAVPVNERSDQLPYFYSENQRNFMWKVFRSSDICFFVRLFVLRAYTIRLDLRK